jgi:cobalt/nickel transport system permease protein
MMSVSMVSLDVPQSRSPIEWVDPRARVLAAAAFTVMVAVACQMPALLAALAIAVCCVAVARLPAAAVFKRLAAINGLMLLGAAVMPWSVPGHAMASVCGWEYTWEGLHRAGVIAVKGNAIILAFAALVGTMELSTLGHALDHLYVPHKLIHLLLFTARYVDVLARQYARLDAAMKVRAFRPGMDRHTWRTYGYLMGMLLVRSLDRSRRIVAAMKCRGFRGTFWLLDHFAYGRRDLAFAALMLVSLAAVAWLEWR